MIGFVALLAFAQSPTNRVRVEPIDVDNPANYTATCSANQERSDAFSLTLSVTGAGKARQLLMKSSDPRVPNGIAVWDRTTNFGERTIDYFVISDVKGPINVGYEYYHQGSVQDLVVNRAPVVGKPVEYLFFADCSAAFEGKTQ